MMIIATVTVSVKFLLALITWIPHDEAVHHHACGFRLLLTSAQNSGTGTKSRASSLTTEMTHSTFCKYSDQVHFTLPEGVGTSGMTLTHFSLILQEP